MKANTERPSAEETKPTLLPAGQHPGLGKLVSKPGIYRTKLRADVAKEKPEHADYKGLLQFEGGRKASVLLWCHADGSLGLRLGNDRKEKGGNVMSPPPEKSKLMLPESYASRPASQARVLTPTGRIRNRLLFLNPHPAAVPISALPERLIHHERRRNQRNQSGI